LEAKWLIYVILKGIGKVSNRFYKFSFLMMIGWGRYEWIKRWRQNVPLENCRWSRLRFNPNILMLIPFIYSLWQFESTEYHILAFLMVIIRFHTKTYWGSRELYAYKYIIKKNSPSRKLQMITFKIQPKHSYVNSIHI
jgi:hypothetical protein